MIIRIDGDEQPYLVNMEMVQCVTTFGFGLSIDFFDEREPLIVKFTDTKQCNRAFEAIWSKINEYVE